MNLLDITLILKPAGQLLFDSQIRDGCSYLSVVCLVIGIVYVLLPINDILDYFHAQDFALADETYSETKNNFMYNYDTLHPLKQYSFKCKTIKMSCQSPMRNLTPAIDKIQKKKKTEKHEIKMKIPH